MTHSMPFLLSLCAFLVLSCFGYLCYIKVAKSIGCFLLYLGRCGSEQPAIRPSGTGGGRLCLKDRQVWVGPALGRAEMPAEEGGDHEFPEAPVHSFMISYTVRP